MNIPYGKRVVEALNTKDLNEKNMISDLIAKKFNGYLSVTIKSSIGFDDGLIIFKEGVLAGAHYKILSAGKELYGAEALKLTFNAFESETGVIDLYNLSSEQTELMLTFNEKAKVKEISKVKDLQEHLQESFDETLIRGYVSSSEGNKYDIFKRIGLGNLRV